MAAAGPPDQYAALSLILEESPRRRSRLPRDAAVHLESGAGTEQTLTADREAFTRHVIKPKPMCGVSRCAVSTAHATRRGDSP